MKLFSAIVLSLLLLGCNNSKSDPGTDTNTPAETNAHTPNNTSTTTGQSGDNILTSFKNLEIQYNDIKKRVKDEKEKWKTSNEEMQYPESTIQSLSEENQKKLAVLYEGARNQGERYDALINEVDAWSSAWEDMEYRASLIRKNTDSGENLDNQELTQMNQKILESRQKIQDWSNRLSKLKTETVLIYNSINGIVVSSTVN